MSVINKMLQDLDRRQALGAGAEATAVRAPSAKTSGHEWFWRILVVLLTAALAWMGWVAVQLVPRKPLVTELAFQAAAEARSRAPEVKSAEPAPAVVAEEPRIEEVKTTPPPQVSETLRLALTLEAPLRPEPERPAKKEREKEKEKAAAPPQPVAIAAKPPAVDKRERTRSANDTAESHFRRAALLLNHGRVSEAEEHLSAALRADAAHTAARQAYVALLLEQRRVDMAQRLLQEALAINPQQPTFALTLARIHTGQREYGAALEVLDRAGSAGAGSADFQAMRGAVLQRIGRHAEAVDAYQSALRGGGTQPPTSWIGLGISLETLGRRSEAITAYRRALAAGPIAAEAREYAESRARALE